MRRRPPRKMVLAAIAVLPIIAAGALAFGVLSLADGPGTSTDDLYAAAEATDLPETAHPGPIASGDEVVSALPGDRISGSPAQRIVIERLEVDATLVTLNIDATGTMEAPDGPELVGWYDFTTKPGLGTGNAVFAAHRDWRGYGPAVFGDLEELVSGDAIHVILADGVQLEYAVTATHTYPVEEMDMRELLAQTEQETLTLITCAGAFEAGDYQDRHVVRAVRVSPSS